jgi:regulator of protease activity HflC (stomatin/prohibitin superfamily)
MKRLILAAASRLRRFGYLIKAFAWAILLGIIETVTTSRGRRILGVVGIVGASAGFILAHPVRGIGPGEVGVRTNRLTGGVTVLEEGWGWVLPGVHELRTYTLRDQVYKPKDAQFQSVEGLSLGVEVAVRYALDPAGVSAVARSLPRDVDGDLVKPTIDGVVHRVLAQHTVREIFATQRGAIEQALTDELRPLLGKDGVAVRGVFIGQVDLPAQYRAGLDALLAEELSAEKMRYTLELEEKKIKQSELEAEADKVRREKAAEAAGQEEIIAAKARAEAMQHVLPLKEKEIEQKRLEAEAAKVVRLKQAEGEAEARRIEAAGEADSRRKLAESDTYRLELTNKATAEQMARESALIAKNPLLIQKTLADKLSDKIQVVIAPPGTNGFFAGNLVGGGAQTAAAAPVAHPESEE